LFLNDDIVKADLGAILMETFVNVLKALPLWGWGAVIVIGALAVDGYVKIRRMQIKHAERMAKIQQGIDPGDETEAYKKDEV